MRVTLREEERVRIRTYMEYISPPMLLFSNVFFLSLFLSITSYDLIARNSLWFYSLLFYTVGSERDLTYLLNTQNKRQKKKLKILNISLYIFFPYLTDCPLFGNNDWVQNDERPRTHEQPFDKAQIFTFFPFFSFFFTRLETY